MMAALSTHLVPTTSTHLVMTSWMHRQKGNDLYHALLADTSLPSAAQEACLQECIQCYNRALETASTEEDRASASKDLAIAHGKYIQLQLGGKDEAVFHLQKLWEAYGLADQSGSISKPAAWKQALLNAANDFMEMLLDVLRHCYDFSVEERLDLYTQLGFDGAPALATARARLLYELGNTLFQQAAVMLEKREFIRGLHFLMNASRPQIEAQQTITALQAQGFLVDERLQADVRVLAEDLHLQEYVLRSQRSLHLAHQYFLDATGKEAGIDMGMLYNCLDELRFAIRLAEDVDVETEAEAFALLGKIYAKVLKQEHHGKQFCQQAIKLALSMTPKHFGNVEWFKEAAAFVRAQNEERERLSSDWKTEFLKELEEELKELQEKESRAKPLGGGHVEDYLRYIYTRYKPKKDSYTLKEPIAGNEKSRLKRALIHYHPDAEVNSVAHDKWYVLCERLTQSLTAVYEEFK
eukprot:m.199294 g.199294  ORF g.199294 m.199294 type:complete len:467 (+) comp16841_c2_seq3:265-1665(+)